VGEVIAFPLGSKKQPRRDFHELDIVVTTIPIMVRGRIIPRGSQGTITDINSVLEEYDVEFYRPFHCVVTLQRSQIR
jgi:hypothetical protein